MALNSGNNGKAHVLEISNRATIQTLTTEAVVTLTDRIANHESSLNTNAHQISNIFGLQTELNSKEPAILTKNTAFNKNYGSTSDTVCQGNDSRLSDARTPLAHTHTISNITGLQTTLEGKASTTHSHVISDIVNLQTTLDSKVDEVVGKGLSTNDLTDEIKGQYDSAVLLSHTHTNKTLLDSLVSNGNGTKYLSDDGTYKTVIGGGVGGNGVDTFVELTDTPSTYVGQ